MNSNATGIDAEAPLAPVSAGERIQTMDVLRGGALFGILWMNTPTNGEPVSGLDRGVLLVGNVLADGKFLALYSFLFGLGFAVQLLRAEQRGAAVVPLYLRRLAVLLLIGLAHGIFLWHGDILQFYAVAGLVLLALQDVRPRLVLILAGLCLVLQVFAGELSDGINALRRLEPEAARVEALREEVRDLDHRAIAQRVVAAEEYGTYWNLVSARAVQETAAYWPLDSNLGEWSDGVVLCMFLLGLYSGRRGIFQDPAAHLRFLRRVMWWGVGIGLRPMWRRRWQWQWRRTTSVG